MTWWQLYPKEREPSLADIAVYTDTPLWAALLEHVETTYGVAPKVEYSVCSGAPGWNVKYRKGGRALCTLYPREGYYICLVSVGAAEAEEAELALPTCTDYLKALYSAVKPFNGARWLMVNVTDADILRDTERLIALRTARKH